MAREVERMIERLVTHIGFRNVCVIDHARRSILPLGHRPNLNVTADMRGTAIFSWATYADADALLVNGCSIDNVRTLEKSRTPNMTVRRDPALFVAGERACDILADADYAFFRPSPLSNPLAGAPASTRRQAGGDTRWKQLLAAVTKNGGFLVVEQLRQSNDVVEVKTIDMNEVVRRYWHYGVEIQPTVVRSVRKQCCYKSDEVAPKTSDVFAKLPVTLLALVASFSWMPDILALYSVCSRSYILGEAYLAKVTTFPHLTKYDRSIHVVTFRNLSTASSSSPPSPVIDLSLP
jgi:hypothetical protein